MADRCKWCVWVWDLEAKERVRVVKAWRRGQYQLRWVYPTSQAKESSPWLLFRDKSECAPTRILDTPLVNHLAFPELMVGAGLIEILTSSEYVWDRLLPQEDGSQRVRVFFDPLAGIDFCRVPEDVRAGYGTLVDMNLIGPSNLLFNFKGPEECPDNCVITSSTLTVFSTDSLKVTIRRPSADIVEPFWGVCSEKVWASWEADPNACAGDMIMVSNPPASVVQLAPIRSWDFNGSATFDFPCSQVVEGTMRVFFCWRSSNFGATVAGAKLFALHSKSALSIHVVRHPLWDKIRITSITRGTNNVVTVTVEFADQVQLARLVPLTHLSVTNAAINDLVAQIASIDGLEVSYAFKGIQSRFVWFGLGWVGFFFVGFFSSSFQK